MRPRVLSIAPYAAGNTALIAAVQQLVGGQPLTLVGGSPFVNDVPRSVLLTFAVGDVSAAIAEDGGVFTDETSEANSAAANDMTLFPAVPVAGVDRYNFGSDAKFASIDINVGTVGTGTYTVVWEYFNGSIFTPLSGVTDDTTNFKTSGTNTVSFTVPSDWVVTTINGQGPFFYIRAEIQTGTVTAVPIGTQAFAEATAVGNRFLIRGTSSKGNELVESVIGAATSVESQHVFASILSITPENNIGADVSAGTVSVVSTPWLPLDYLRTDFQVALGLSFGGAITPDFTVELTLSNILDRRGNSPLPTVGTHFGSEFDLVFPTINIHDHDTLVNQIADATGNLDFPVRAIRLKSNAVFTVDPVSLEVVQSSHGG